MGAAGGPAVGQAHGHHQPLAARAPGASGECFFGTGGVLGAFLACFTAISAKYTRDLFAGEKTWFSVVFWIMLNHCFG